ncbi:MAG TPA: helix-hairpin-helix domain-containing protein [Methylomirabilota bacterium]|nr:helix-hairpin-helix domain-containing protein [Methylomirabilota bacterium]
MTASNQLIADRLREAADLLEQQAANPFRVRAYREAAHTVAGLAEDVALVHERNGVAGLDALPGIGPRIAAAITEMLRTGRWSQLERLRGSLDAEPLFQAIPGVGPALARRIHEALHVDTLEALEVAAHDGRLASVPGIGPRRAAVLRAGLAGMLGRTRLRPRGPIEEPPVATLLDVDRQYRDEAAAGRLPRIAPRRFNPEGRAWLPVLHAERGPWQFTVLFSNTARAHELGKTQDWVVVYFHTDTRPEGQRTVVTETFGRLAGRRVVRGRESECRAAYGIPESSQGAPSPSKVNRKSTPKIAPRVQNAGRPM